MPEISDYIYTCILTIEGAVIILGLYAVLKLGCNKIYIGGLARIVLGIDVRLIATIAT